MIPLDHRRDWIEPGHPVLSISEQYRIDDVPRSSIFNQKDTDKVKYEGDGSALSQRFHTG